MLVKTYGSAVSGIDAFTVTMEVNISAGIKFFLVGLPDSAVKESEQRIDSAIRENGWKYPQQRIVINMAPADIRKEGKEMTYLRPDSKSQVTIEYSDNGVPQRIDTIVVSTQHDDFVKDANGNDDDEAMLAKIREDVINILIPRVKAQVGDKVLALFNDDIKYFVNPTGKFVIGGPHGDTGLTGRKIIVDTYGGKGAHGGGAFSGKDSSKVDRSAAYAARYIAKNMVAAGVADEMLVQVAYAIGVAKPVSIYVDTYGKSHVNMTDGEMAAKIAQMFDLRPKAIERKLKLRQPMYLETAAYGTGSIEIAECLQECGADCLAVAVCDEGVGGLTFGLSMRYLGVALGQSIALGTCAGLGTIMGPVLLNIFFPEQNALASLTASVIIGVGDIRLSYRDVVLEVEVVIYSTERQGLLFLKQGETLEQLTLILILAEQWQRLKECLEK